MIIDHIYDTIHSTVFNFIELLILLGSTGIIIFRNIIYSAILLGFVLLCVALLYLLLNIDFIATAQILIYVGGVNVLIVFVIMLVNIPYVRYDKIQTSREHISGLVITTLFIILNSITFSTSWQHTDITFICLDTFDTKYYTNDINIIGLHLLTDCLLPFELLSMLLLTALIGAIIAARKNIEII
jgi:NAD(P)H-quinone oxidoreductase subunit 6